MDRIRRIEGNLYGFTPRSEATDKANAELLFQQAVNAEVRGEPEVALEWYRQALDRDRSLFCAWTNIGTIWLHRGDYAMAERCYRNALEINPTYAMAHYNLARTFDELGRDHEAMEAYRQAIAADPHHADAHYNLAVLCEEKTHEYGRAMEHWQCYLRFGPVGDDEFAQRARDGIRRVSSKLPRRVVPKPPVLLAANSNASVDKE